jgi:hypothetical protein
MLESSGPLFNYQMSPTTGRISSILLIFLVEFTKDFSRFIFEKTAANINSCAHMGTSIATMS